MTGTGYSESHIEMFRSQGAYPKIALSFLSFFPARGHSAGKTAAAPSTFSRWQVSVLSPSWSLSLMWCRLTECLWGVLPSKYQRLNQVGLSKKKKKKYWFRKQNILGPVIVRLVSGSELSVLRLPWQIFHTGGLYNRPLLSLFWRLEVPYEGVGRARSLWGCEGASAPCLSPTFGWLADNLCHSLKWACVKY